MANEASVRPDRRPLVGVVLVVGATFMFACNDVTNKHLLVEHDVPLVAAVRYIVHAILMLAIVAPIQRNRLFRVNRTGLVLVRSLCLVVATFLGGLAFQRMPIAEATSIIYLAPILIVLLAQPILGERIGTGGWAAVIAGFIGVVLIVRPGSGLDPAGVIYAMSNVGFTVAYSLLSRVLAQAERTLALLFYSALAGALCFGVAMPWFWFDAIPSLMDLAMFLSLGVTAGLGHFMFTAASQFTPASMLAPVSYIHLLWATLFGWLVFGHLPDALGIAGMSIIACAGVLAALRSRRSS